MANNLEIHATHWIVHKRRIVTRMGLRPEPGLPVTRPACLQSRGVEFADLIGVCVFCIYVFLLGEGSKGGEGGERDGTEQLGNCSGWGEEKKKKKK